MGKAKILSGGENGLYNIELIEHTTRITAAIAKIDARLPVLDKAIEDALTNRATALADYNAKKAALDTVIGQYIINQAKKTEVDFAQSAYLQAMKSLQEKSFTYSLLLQEKESKTKQKALLEAIPLSHTVDGVWCADLTEDLEAGAEVGTIEPNGEPDGDIIIYPKGTQEPFKEQLQPVMSSTPAGYFLNIARFPGWQRWKPTYRIGTITAIVSGEDLCDLILDESLSTARELNINPSSLTLSNVPVEYLTCNARAFSVGDRVVVSFINQSWSTPKVIGFESEPRACDEYAVFIIGDIGTAVAVVWNIAMNKVELGPVAVTDASYVSWLNDHKSKGEAMFSGFLWDVDTPYKIDPDLVDPAPESTWTTMDYTKYHDFTEHTSYGAKWYDWFPECAYASVLLDPEVLEYAGLRTQRVYHEDYVHRFEVWNPATGHRYWYSPPDYPDFDVYDHTGGEERTSNITQDYSFYGPLGVMGTFGGTEYGHWLTYSAGSTYWTRDIEKYFIPEWPATINPAFTPEEQYAKGRFWYGSSLAGKMSDDSFAMVLIIQYTPCTYTSSLVNPESSLSNQTWEFDNDRTILVQAQAANIPESGDWKSTGNNAVLAGLIKTGVEMYYSVNSYPDTEIRAIVVGVDIMR